MLKIKLIQGDEPSLRHAIREFNDDPSISFIMMFLASQSVITNDEINGILKSSQKPIAGGLFPYVIHEKTLLPEGIVLIGFSCDFQMAVIQNISEESHISRELQKQLPWQNNDQGTLFCFVHGLSPGLKHLIHELFNQYGLEINYIGGGCGLSQSSNQPCVITPNGMLEDSAVLILANVNSGIGVAHGWQSISRALKVTEAVDNEIISIDWRPAAEVYKNIVEDHSGLRFSELPFADIARAYPFGVAKLADELVIRDPFYLKGSSIVCFGDVRCGSYIHVMNGKPDFISAAAGRACAIALEGLHGKKPDALFFMDCMSRALFLGELFAREITHVAMDNVPIVGALTIGEIANCGYDYLELYNKTSVVGLISSDAPSH